MKLKRGIKIPQETKLFVIGLVLFVLLITSIVYTFIFVANDIVPALISDVEPEAGEIHFDLEGFEQLGI